jgi:phosphoserine phosphatase
MAYVATVIALSQGISDTFTEKFENLLRSEGITTLRLEYLKPGAVVDYYLDIESIRFNEIKNAFFEFSNTHGVDIVLQQANDDRKNKGLFVFDMDSTLIQQEVIDMIAAYANVEPEVSKITEAAMNGEIDFNESLKQRVALLKGIPSTVFEDLKSKITFTPGARSLTRILSSLGVKTAVLSGGFIPLANWVKGELGLDYAYANNLEVTEDGTELTGRTYGTVVNNVVKGELLQEIAQKEGVPLSKVVAVGDGSNDLVMMGIAGFGIAFNAKPVVQKKAPSRINTPSLETILYILGYNEKDQEKLLSA